MRFRLLGKDGETKLHEGAMARAVKPAVVSWGHRAFVLVGEVTLPKTAGGDVVATYREVDTFRIGL